MVNTERQACFGKEQKAKSSMTFADSYRLSILTSVGFGWVMLTTTDTVCLQSTTEMSERTGLFTSTYLVNCLHIYLYVTNAMFDIAFLQCTFSKELLLTTWPMLP